MSVGITGKFAYESFRPGQRELAERVYEASLSGETLVAEAMSGFGKTAAVLTGTLSAAEETESKVVYTCRTKRQVHRVVEEVCRLQSRHPFTAASMFSKFDYCLLRRQSARPVPQESFGWYCWFNVSNNLCSYFMNVPLVPEDFGHAVEGALRTMPTHSELVRESESIHVCPYEVAKLAMAQARIAVVPYQYVFDTKAAPVLFDRNSVDRKKTILVVDEAHNLRDFLRGVHSATLTLDQIEGAVREADAMLMEEASLSLKSLEGILERVMVDRLGWLLDREAVLGEIRGAKGTGWLQNLAFELNACSGAAWGSIAYERRLPSLLLRVGEFLARLTSSDGSLLVKWDRTLGLMYPDPVGGLAPYLDEFRSSILISATINPSAVFNRSLGLHGTGAATFHVPAEPNVVVRTAIDTGVSTRYKLRSPEMFSRISDKVAAVIQATRSGVGVFAPSYAVLAPIAERVSAKLGERHVVSEAPGLSSQEAADVAESFRSSEDSVLFAVQGGRFSEGEDFSEDTMGAVVVVGLSLPPPSPMLYAEYACLRRSGEPDSFLMLSRLPALRKAFQAAGRHIRRPGKRGLVFLLDDRFNSDAVRELMPSWLGKDVVVGDFTTEDLEKFTREFWDSPG
ncbi:MAG: ATP-dependent DNA helicase [Thaumarchaeota archaeon]|nr:ATP-dependent DNA helicase [Nitrososphaerota archaeon]